MANVIVARPDSFLRIAWNWGAGIPWMFATPTTRAAAHRAARSSTSCFLYGATWVIVPPQRYLTAGPMVVFTYADWMLNRPRSSLPTTPRIRASRVSAGSSGGLSRVPIAAGNVRLSRLRTPPVLRLELFRVFGAAGGGRGR